jgi:hypothetical protein
MDGEGGTSYPPGDAAGGGGALDSVILWAGLVQQVGYAECTLKPDAISSALVALLSGCAPPPLPTVEGVAAAPRVISVCELFQSMPWYRGKMGAAHRVLPVLDLESSTLDHELDPPTGFATDEDCWVKIRRAQSALAKGQELWVTITGRLRCSPALPTAGYGHLVSFPRQSSWSGWSISR